MATVRPVYVPPPYRDLLESGSLILRDGTTAAIRVAQPEDRDALQTFVDQLSSESKQHRLFTEAVSLAELIAFLCDPSDPRARLTLIVTRVQDKTLRVIASGSYVSRGESTAEVAIAVDEAFHGKGLGSLLLERLALLAVRQGFVRVWAATRADNRPMRGVLRESGYTVKETETSEGGDVEVELSIVPTETSVARSEVQDRVATAASLRPFFQPRSVAVVGASRDPAGIGHRIVEALVTYGFRGPIYPINPKASAIAGIPAYPTVKALPESVDLAIVAVPRDVVLSVVDDCAARGVRALVVITAGFAEIGTEGGVVQDQLVEKVRGHGMRLVGPNCMGLLNTDPAVRLNASFVQLCPPPGRVAMLSQSGALGVAILRRARRLHLGLSTFISVGNKADVSGNDLLQYWEEDLGTEVILLYLESFGNPRRFARIARRVSRRKPIVAVKSGRTLAGSRAAGSHTAALAASDVGVEALFRQTGVIRADTLEEMFALASALGSQPLPPGRRVAIVTNAGGPSILCADACEAGGLVVTELSEATKRRLGAFLPPEASRNNPVDLIASGGPAQFRLVVETVLTAGEIDALLVIYIPVDPAGAPAVADAIAEGIAAGRAKGGTGKPVYLCWMVEDGEGKPLEAAGERIPSYTAPERSAQVLSKVAAYADWRATPLGMIPDFPDIHASEARDVCSRAVRAQGGGWLSPEETHAVLAAVALPLSPWGLAKTADEAVAVARGLGYPVAVKLVSRHLVHKTELGGVRLNVEDEAATRQAFADIRERLTKDKNLDAMEGVLVQPMISGGVEVMIGMTQDRVFGPLVAFGLGGIHVEILGDVCFRVTPLTDRDAAEMVREIKGSRLLEGYRGHPAADVAALENVLLRVSRLVEEIPEITELDLNPIFALPPGQGCRIVDARIRVAGSALP